MSRQDRRDRLPLVEQQRIRLRYAQIKAALADKRARLLREKAETDMQPNMLEAVMLRAQLAQKERDGANGHA